MKRAKFFLGVVILGMLFSATCFAELVDNGDGTVTDTVENLMWQKETGGDANWAKANTYCENLSLAGYDDWRLPDMSELLKLLVINKDYKNFFPDTHNAHYWAAKPQKGYKLHGNYARPALLFHRGKMDMIISMEKSHYFRAVRSLKGN